MPTDPKATPTPGDTPDGPPLDKGEDTAATVTALKAEVEKWKALSRKHETRAAENAAAATKLQELEDGNKSEIQRLTDRATEAARKAEEAESRANAAELAALRFKVATSKGLTPTQAGRLQGTNEAELETDADELITSFAPAEDSTHRPPVRRPAPRLRGTADPEEEPEETDARALIKDVPR